MDFLRRGKLCFFTICARIFFYAFQPKNCTYTDSKWCGENYPSTKFLVNIHKGLQCLSPKYFIFENLHKIYFSYQSIIYIHEICSYSFIPTPNSYIRGPVACSFGESSTIKNRHLVLTVVILFKANAYLQGQEVFVL